MRLLEDASRPSPPNKNNDGNSALGCCLIFIIIIILASCAGSWNGSSSIWIYTWQSSVKTDLPLANIILSGRTWGDHRPKDQGQGAEPSASPLASSGKKGSDFLCSGEWSGTEAAGWWWKLSPKRETLSPLCPEKRAAPQAFPSGIFGANAPAPHQAPWKIIHILQICFSPVGAMRKTIKLQTNMIFY